MSVQRVFQRLARTKFRNLGLEDFNRLASTRITTGPGSTLSHCKCTETDERYRPALFEGSANGVDRRLQGPRCRSLGNIGVLCDVLDQFCFIHTGLSLGKMDGNRTPDTRPGRWPTLVSDINDFDGASQKCMDTDWKNRCQYETSLARSAILEAFATSFRRTRRIFVE